jgi:hypothetical protein
MVLKKSQSQMAEVSVSGSCLSVCHVDPRLEEEDEDEEEEEEEEEEAEGEYQPPMEVCMKAGDILCKFTIGSIVTKLNE